MSGSILAYHITIERSLYSISITEDRIRRNSFGDICTYVFAIISNDKMNTLEYEINMGDKKNWFIEVKYFSRDFYGFLVYNYVGIMEKNYLSAFKRNEQINVYKIATEHHINFRGNFGLYNKVPI